MIQKKTVEELVKERINELDNGLFIVALSVSSTNVINVELDKKEGNVAVEDCISVSRNVEHNLDREQTDFELSVSSAGLDKPLRVRQQFEKNVGRNVQVKLNEGGKIKGLLKAISEKGIVLETKEKKRIEGKKKKQTVVEEHELAFDAIKETKIVISFK